MRTLFLVIAILLILVGLVWFGQGVGVIPGSVMTNDRTWAWIGGAMVVLGLGIIISRRSR